MSLTNAFLFLILVFKPCDLQFFNFKDEWVLWNIGQGQWVTHIQWDTCLHYDVGGEKSYAIQLRIPIQKLCFQRKNIISISHWDIDHYSLLNQFVKWVPRLCWEDHPQWISKKNKVVQIKELNLPYCKEKAKNKKWRPHFFKNTNESSSVVIDELVLIPGDSPSIKEKQWLRYFKNLDTIQVLILGHHGSRTSTSNELLNQLPRLKWAAASARYAKYHHPHKQTLLKLKKRKVPVLRTEDWGHIHWQ